MTTHHENSLKIIRGDTHQSLDLSKQVEVQWRHSIVVGDSREEVHEDELRVSLPSVTGLLVFRFAGHAALDDNDRRRPVSVF